MLKFSNIKDQKNIELIKIVSLLVHAAKIDENYTNKERDLIIFPNYLMHTAYPFNINAERRSFSFNAKIILDK